MATLGVIACAGVLALGIGARGVDIPSGQTVASTPAAAATLEATATPEPGPALAAVSLRVMSLAFDGTPEPPPPPPPTPEPVLPAGASSPEGLRIWSHGDSTSYYLTVALYKIWAEQGGRPVGPPEYKLSSGLARPELFDWPAFVAAEMARYNPDVAVLMLGGNDVLQLGRHETYAGRVGRMMDLMYREGRVVVWVGQPNMSSERPDYAAAVPTLNAIFRAEAEKRSWVIYVDTWPLTSWSDGTFAWEQPDIYGNLVKIRHEDGIHFTAAGGRHLAVGVMGALFGPR